MWEGALTAAEQKLSQHYGHLLGDSSNTHTSAAALSSALPRGYLPWQHCQTHPDAHNRHGPCLDGHQQLDDTSNLVIQNGILFNYREKWYHVYVDIHVHMLHT